MLEFLDHYSFLSFRSQVVEGQDVVHKIEQTKTDTEDKPISPVVILESGTIAVPEPFFISDDPYE